jgi:hypothetical protein
MSEPTKKQESDLISRLAFVFGMLVAFTGGLVVKGALRWSTWEWTKIRVGLIYFFIVTTVVYAKSHDIPFMIDHMTSFIPLGLGDWVYFHIARSVQLVILTVIPFLMRRLTVWDLPTRRAASSKPWILPPQALVCGNSR